MPSPRPLPKSADGSNLGRAFYDDCSSSETSSEASYGDYRSDESEEYPPALRFPSTLDEEIEEIPRPPRRRSLPTRPALHDHPMNALCLDLESWLDRDFEVDVEPFPVAFTENIRREFPFIDFPDRIRVLQFSPDDFARVRNDSAPFLEKRFLKFIQAALFCGLRVPEPLPPDTIVFGSYVSLPGLPNRFVEYTRLSPAFFLFASWHPREYHNSPMVREMFEYQMLGTRPMELYRAMSRRHFDPTSYWLSLCSWPRPSILGIRYHTFVVAWYYSHPDLGTMRWLYIAGYILVTPALLRSRLMFWLLVTFPITIISTICAALGVPVPALDAVLPYLPSLL